jgi:hypothetical protein
MFYSTVSGNDECSNCNEEKQKLINKKNKDDMKKEFTNRWCNSTSSEKLNFYGKKKLLLLAKKKGIKGCCNMLKSELIEKLSQIVNKDDFPIV